jgi:L-iditol 2-dehydrogenase
MCAQFKNTNLDPGGFAEFVKISAAHLKHTTFKVPSTLDWQEALFTEPLACCVRNMDRLPLLAQDTVVVIGLGSIGLMMTKLLKRLSCTVIGIDLDPARCELGLSYGVDAVFNSTQDPHFLSLIKKTEDGRGCDGVIFTAGPAQLLNESLSWVRGGGFLNLFSHLSGKMATLDTATLYHHEIQLITTYSASPDSLKKAFEILRDENLGLRKMVAPVYAPEQLAHAIEDINRRKILKAVITF